MCFCSQPLTSCIRQPFALVGSALAPFVGKRGVLAMVRSSTRPSRLRRSGYGNHCRLRHNPRHNPRYTVWRHEVAGECKALFTTRDRSVRAWPHPHRPASWRERCSASLGYAIGRVARRPDTAVSRPYGRRRWRACVGKRLPSLCPHALRASPTDAPVRRGLHHSSSAARSWVPGCVRVASGCEGTSTVVDRFLLVGPPTASTGYGGVGSGVGPGGLPRAVGEAR